MEEIRNYDDLPEHFKELVKKRREIQIQEIEHEEKPKGLGDTIAKVTKAIGIKPCGGCKKRQSYLNEKFPYKK